MAQEFISKTILANILETDQPVLIIDIRSADVYRLSKIIGALNVNLPATSILLRRIRNRTFEFTQLFSVEHKVVFFAYRQTRRIVLYDSNTSDLTEEGADVIEILFNSLRSMGFRVCCLKGGFEEFSIDYPQWLHHSLSTNGFEPGMNGVPALAPIGTSEVQMLPWSRPENKRPFPKPYPNAVTTYLFLGNGEVAGNLSKLQEKNITFVLNLTPNIPNYFEGEESGITYLRIPLTDSVTESLIPHITDANNFIEQAYLKKTGVLVHCHAGVSRSPAICLAYLMSTAQSSMSSCYAYLMNIQPSISPNWGFLAELDEYGKSLPFDLHDYDFEGITHVQLEAFLHKN